MMSSQTCKRNHRQCFEKQLMAGLFLSLGRYCIKKFSHHEEEICNNGLDTVCSEGLNQFEDFYFLAL